MFSTGPVRYSHVLHLYNIFKHDPVSSFLVKKEKNGPIQSGRVAYIHHSGLVIERADRTDLYSSSKQFFFFLYSIIFIAFHVVFFSLRYYIFKQILIFTTYSVVFLFFNVLLSYTIVYSWLILKASGFKTKRPIHIEFDLVYIIM